MNRSNSGALAFLIVVLFIGGIVGGAIYVNGKFDDVETHLSEERQYWQTPFAESLTICEDQGFKAAACRASLEDLPIEIIQAEHEPLLKPRPQP